MHPEGSCSPLARALVLAGSLLAVPRAATADCLDCRSLNVSFTVEAAEFAPQIVIWAETPTGEYIDTIFMTNATGRYGLGNRPGAIETNSGPNWPYGRRESVFPIWSHRYTATHGTWPRLEFQDGHDTEISHSIGICSPELHFSQPLHPDTPEWDAGTGASTAYTDKGKFGIATSNYPPRADLVWRDPDSHDVELFASMNPFDAVSHATPMAGLPATIAWQVPAGFPANAVIWIETSREFDMNATYNPSVYPSPTIPWGDYGLAYRGQPSVVFAMTMDNGVVAFSGYGDPEGADGNVRLPDSTITNASSRLANVHAMIDSTPDCIAPAAPPSVIVDGSVVTFTSPGDDGLAGTPTGYEVRYRANDITESDFATATLVDQSAMPVESGRDVTVELGRLLPETDYTVAIRAFDSCGNVGPLAFARFRTPDRVTGEVDACFIATAAYGSVMASDVALLRHFRDAALRNSVLGELFVESYYTFGPAVAGVIGESDLLRETARAALAPIVDAIARRY